MCFLLCPDIVSYRQDDLKRTHSKHTISQTQSSWFESMAAMDLIDWSREPITMPINCADDFTERENAQTKIERRKTKNSKRKKWIVHRTGRDTWRMDALCGGICRNLAELLVELKRVQSGEFLVETFQWWEKTMWSKASSGYLSVHKSLGWWLTTCAFAVCLKRFSASLRSGLDAVIFQFYLMHTRSIL